MDYPFDGSQTILRYTVVDEKNVCKRKQRKLFKNEGITK